MQVLENTERWCIVFFDAGRAISIMDKPTEDVYNFYGDDCELFFKMLQSVSILRGQATSVRSSIHFGKSFDESIEYIINEMKKERTINVQI